MEQGDDALGQAREEAEAIVQRAQEEAARITDEATLRAQESIEVLLLTAQGQRAEMLDDQTRRNKLVDEYERELSEQIAVLQHDLAKLKGEMPDPLPEPEVVEDVPEETVAEAAEEEQEAAEPEAPASDTSIWTDSEITDSSPRPVPINDVGP
jgi:hypothetical protein